MEQFLAVMLLVGCSSDQEVCSEIPVATPFYSSVEDCRTDLGLQMRMTSTYDNKVFGTCTPVDEAMMEQSGTVEWAINRAGELIVEIRPDEPQVASAEQPEIGVDDVRVAAR